MNTVHIYINLMVLQYEGKNLMRYSVAWPHTSIEGGSMPGNVCSIILYYYNTKLQIYYKPHHPPSIDSDGILPIICGRIIKYLCHNLLWKGDVAFTILLISYNSIITRFIYVQ